MLILSRGFGWLPPLGYADLWDDPWKNIQQMFLPALALGFYDMAFIARVTRSSMMEIIREDYMRTARAKGLAERIVLGAARFEERGAAYSDDFGLAVRPPCSAETVIIESIFKVPGIGTLLIETVFQRDFPTIQAIIIVIAVSIVIINLLVDLLYGLLDPRIRYA